MIKNMKKMIVAGTFITGLAISSNAFAAEVETDTTITNITTLPDVTTVTVGPAGSLKADSKVRCVDPLFGSPYAVATSNSNILSDYIYAKVRVYGPTGGIRGSKEDAESNSKYAGATYTDNSSTTPDFAMGNHTYQKKNYKSIYHELKAWF